MSNKESDKGKTFTGRFQGMLKYGFGTYKGLVTLIIAYLTLAILFLGTFSQPIIEIFGKPLIPIVLDDAFQFSRIIMLYHSLAMPFLAAVVFLVLDTCNVREKFKPHIKWPILVGSLLTSTMGLTFAYILQRNMIAHAFFILGLCLVFYGGVVLLIGTVPTKNFPDYEKNKDGSYLGRLNLEQLNIMLVAFCLLITASIAAYVGANIGNSQGLFIDSPQVFSSPWMQVFSFPFLAEDWLRFEHETLPYLRMIIAHLHNMLAMIDVAVLLIVFRRIKVTKLWYLVAQILIIPGTLITSIGAWLVVPGYEDAHVIINVGAAFLLSASLILVIFGFIQISKKVLGENYETASIWKRFISVFKDSVNFGLYWLFIWVNFVVTAPGVYTALNLDYVRSKSWIQERTFASGHWHVLATLTAMMVLLFYIDYINMKGVLRTIIGWFVTVGSLVGFGAALYYMMVDYNSSFAMIITDIGVMALFAAIGSFCIYQLVKILKGDRSKEIEQ